MIRELSVIIPTYNEAGNIALLVKRLAQTLGQTQISYELIFIDDHSTDNTWQEIHSLQHQYPIRFTLKKGRRGKAYSLLEGFALAKYKLLAMIDADLQYPPEVLPAMVKKINRGADIVVANRDESKIPLARQLFSKTFRFLFIKLLYGLDLDAQSGLKVFKKEIIERLTLTPSPWTFDLEFLVKSLNAGYVLDLQEIKFASRYKGKSKVNLIKTSWEIGRTALTMKFNNPEIIPFSPRLAQKYGYGFHLNSKKYFTHTNFNLQESAFNAFNDDQKIIILLGLILILLAVKLNWHLTIVILMAIITLFYFSDLLFNLFLTLRGFAEEPKRKVTNEEIAQLTDKDLPTYTILCPLYQEWRVLDQFVSAVARLDYPKAKLQVLLLLEEDDKETIEKVNTYNLPNYFSKIIVPNSNPKTKPKALNYGLTLTQGEYVVVYDAEDVPDPKQLKKVVIAFERAGKETIAVQAKLNFYNPKQDLLTKLFTAEYSLWFDLVLTGLQSFEAPIPLGGSSNHFRTADLKKLNGWDPFNVTEDCDLGIRLVEKGYKTAMVDSLTLEEANSDIRNWFNQRTRWIKGYIQTYLVHMNSLHKSKQSNNWLKLVAFHLMIGNKSLSLLTNIFMWFISIAYFMFRSHVGNFIESFFPPVIFYMGVSSMVIGNFLYFYSYMIGCAKREQYELIKYIFLVPFYWLLMSVAAWVAAYRLLVEPYYWFKTKHGLHLTKRQFSGEFIDFGVKGIINRPAIVCVYGLPSKQYSSH